MGNITSELYDQIKAKHLFLDKEFGFSMYGFSINVKEKSSLLTTNTMLRKLLDCVYIKKNKKVLFTIDKADNSKEMRTFIQSFESFKRGRLSYTIINDWII